MNAYLKYLEKRIDSEAGKMMRARRPAQPEIPGFKFLCDG